MTYREPWRSPGFFIHALIESTLHFLNMLPWPRGGNKKSIEQGLCVNRIVDIVVRKSTNEWLVLVQDTSPVNPYIFEANASNCSGVDKTPWLSIHSSIWLWRGFNRCWIPYLVCFFAADTCGVDFMADATYIPSKWDQYLIPHILGILRINYIDRSILQVSAYGPRPWDTLHNSMPTFWRPISSPLILENCSLRAKPTRYLLTQSNLHLHLSQSHMPAPFLSLSRSRTRWNSTVSERPE